MKVLLKGPIQYHTLKNNNHLRNGEEMIQEIF